MAQMQSIGYRLRTEGSELFSAVVLRACHHALVPYRDDESIGLAVSGE